MHDNQEFLLAAEATLDSLKRHLIAREDDDRAEFEVEERGGALYVRFARPGASFLVAANATVRQIWISAAPSDLRLDWDSRMEKFIFPLTGETIITLVDRLIREQHAG